MDRLFKMFVKTVQFGSGYSFCFLKNTVYSIRFIISIQLYNDFVLSILLPPHELSIDFLCEKEYESENLQETTFLKI